MTSKTPKPTKNEDPGVLSPDGEFRAEISITASASNGRVTGFSNNGSGPLLDANNEAHVSGKYHKPRHDFFVYDLARNFGGLKYEMRVTVQESFVASAH